MKLIEVQRDRAISFNSRLRVVALAIIALTQLGCGTAGPRPLSIKMYNAEKNTTLDCAARDLGNADRNMLADSVEACARQLERNGFVRQSSTP